MAVLGISALYHDSAAALVGEDGTILAAAQEERFTRRKHDATFPKNAVQYCLEGTGTSVAEVESVVFYEKPFIKFERLLETYLAFVPRGIESFAMAITLWIKEKLFQKKLLIEELSKLYPEVGWKEKLLFTEHHLSHAASAFFPSPFEEAAILTMDGVGEWATTSLAIGRGNTIEAIKEIHFPHSLGLLYSAFTYYTGFKVNSGEYKVMGLAPYGVPRFKEIILDKIVHVKPDGTFRLNMDYFDYCTGLRMTNGKFEKLFGVPTRKADEWLRQEHMDLAASIQAVTEEIVLKLGRSVAEETGMRNLCLAGGVALNCVANGKVLKEKFFEGIWIQPASGDAGGALGAALMGHYVFKNKERKPVARLDGMKGSYLGPEFAQEEIEKRLTAVGGKYEVLAEDALIDETAQALREGKAVGWFQGRMEYGPRALGARSILGDARSESMQKTLNLRIKFRESFRPFAPSVLAEDVSQYFELEEASPYMLLVADVQKARRRSMTEEEQKLFGIDRLNTVRSDIPAVTHVDYSARVQTVHEETNPKYYRLIKRFKDMTGCSVIVNTSFNVRGEPIVGTPEDAFRCFMGTDMDVLAIGNCILKKEGQDPSLKVSYQDKFQLD